MTKLRLCDIIGKRCSFKYMHPIAHSLESVTTSGLACMPFGDQIDIGQFILERKEKVNSSAVSGWTNPYLDVVLIRKADNKEIGITNLRLSVEESKSDQVWIDAINLVEEEPFFRLI